MDCEGKALEELRYEYYQSSMLFTSSKKETQLCSVPFSSFFKESEGTSSQISSKSPFSAPCNNTTGFGVFPAISSSAPFGSTIASSMFPLSSSTATGGSSSLFGTSSVFGSPSTSSAFSSSMSTGISRANNIPSLFDSTADSSSSTSSPCNKTVPDFGALPGTGTTKRNAPVSLATATDTSLPFKTVEKGFSLSGAAAASNFPEFDKTTIGTSSACITTARNVTPVFSATDKNSTPSVSGTSIFGFCTSNSTEMKTLKPRKAKFTFKHGSSTPEDGSTRRVTLPSCFYCMGKTPQTWFKEPSLEEEIMCSVCFEVYATEIREPVILPYCGHSFCRPCLMNLERKGSLKCPTCRKSHSDQSISVIPVIYSILNLSEAYSKAKDSGTVLERCDAHGDQLCLWCKECNEPLCGLCVLDNHRDQQNHTVERILGISDFDKDIVQKYALGFFQYSERQQNRTINELQFNIKRVMELCQVIGNVKNQVREVKDILKNRKNITSLKSTAETLTVLRNAHEAVSLATKSLKEVVHFGLQDSETTPPTEVSKESKPKELMENTDNQESECGVLEEQETLNDEVDMSPFRCCAKSSDGRQMLLQVEENRLHAYALADMAEDAHITLQVQLLESILFQDKAEVFLDLSTDNLQLGRVYIQLWGHMRRAKHFFALCLGTLGPSYRGAKFDHISDFHYSGEVLHCMNYIDKNVPTSKGLMKDLEWDGKYRQLQKAGLLIASGFGQPEKDGCFGICTKAHPLKTFSCPFGMVLSGMDLIHTIITENNVSKVTITEVGAVL